MGMQWSPIRQQHGEQTLTGLGRPQRSRPRCNRLITSDNGFIGGDLVHSEVNQNSHSTSYISFIQCSNERVAMRCKQNASDMFSFVDACYQMHYLVMHLRISESVQGALQSYKNSKNPK